MMKPILRFTCYLFFLVGFLISCKKSEDPTPPSPTPTDTATVQARGIVGFSFLNRLPGIWNGRLTSHHLGVFPEWIVDFRPIAESSLMGKSELDKNNDIFMGFFPVKKGNDSLLAFRNGGHFAGATRVSYLVVDSIVETSTRSYYRFVDVVKGKSRLYATFEFKNDSLLMESYSNGQFHMRWEAIRKDTNAFLPAKQLFQYPKKVIVKDFTNAFAGRNDATFFDNSLDIYPEEEHPYLGKVTVQIQHAANVPADSVGKVYLVTSTQPFYNGFIPDLNVLSKRSRYVILENTPNHSYVFTYHHPGNYYLNAFLDRNGDGLITSGEYICLNERDKPFALTNRQQLTTTIRFDFQVP